MIGGMEKSMGCVCAGKKGAECGQGGGEREKIGFGGILPQVSGKQKNERRNKI